MMDTTTENPCFASIPDEINPKGYRTILDVLEYACSRYADKPAFSCLGHTLSYAELDRLSSAFAAYLQHETELDPGDRIAVQMPNLLQYPVVVFGALRAGLIVVNTNPLYTAREMEHQFNDSGAKALVVLANMADLAERVMPNTPLRHVVVTEVADLHRPLKRVLINSVVKHVKKQVPDYRLAQAVPLRRALSLGQRTTCKPYTPDSEEIAILQYTGGTTGVAKGAMLTHRNLVANKLQLRHHLGASIGESQELFIAPLPLYHIYAFTMHCMALLGTGNHSVLIPNPRDIGGFVKELKKWRFTGFVGLNTLFCALCREPEFRALDFSQLKLTSSGGMALTADTARQWINVTGCTICEGYGLTETSPVVSANTPQATQLGTIGWPAPLTEVKIVDPKGRTLSQGEVGELCVRGPQVMKGYWQRPEETAQTLCPEGWLRTGDMAVRQADGYLKIVDRIKDMVIVSGFNVYPNEVEDVACQHPAVAECAVIGVPDEKSGEAIKLFVTPADPDVTVQEIRDFCRDRLTAYKVPKFVEFIQELPKSNVGKVLRRQLKTDNSENVTG